MDAVKELSGFRLLTEKPWLVIVNTDPGDGISAELMETMQIHGLSGMPIAARNLSWSSVFFGCGAVGIPARYRIDGRRRQAFHRHGLFQIGFDFFSNDRQR